MSSRGRIEDLISALRNAGWDISNDNYNERQATDLFFELDDALEWRIVHKQSEASLKLRIPIWRHPGVDCRGRPFKDFGNVSVVGHELTLDTPNSRSAEWLNELSVFIDKLQQIARANS